MNRFLLLPLSALSATLATAQPDYTLIKEDNIFVEVFDTTITHEGQYTENNRMFRAGTKAASGKPAW